MPIDYVDLICDCGNIYKGWYPTAWKNKEVKEPKHCKDCSNNLSKSIIHVTKIEWNSDFRLVPAGGWHWTKLPVCRNLLTFRNG